MSVRASPAFRRHLNRRVDHPCRPLRDRQVAGRSGVPPRGPPRALASWRPRRRDASRWKGSLGRGYSSLSSRAAGSVPRWLLRAFRPRRRLRLVLGREGCVRRAGRRCAAIVRLRPGPPSRILTGAATAPRCRGRVDAPRRGPPVTAAPVRPRGRGHGRPGPLARGRVRRRLASPDTRGIASTV
jgi:hypothetical protein